MKKSEKAQFVMQTLNSLYPCPSIPLAHTDPYTLLIAVILSAQCTDERVNKITPILFAKASTPEAMVELSSKAIENVIRPCGLGPAKSKSIFCSSKILLEKFQGKVPKTFEQLELLPGVGHKTASVVMSHAFGVPAFPVDTHIHRLMYRWGLSSGKNVVQTEKDVKRLFPEKYWELLHLQIIYFGRQYCPARSHKVVNCPICAKIGRKSL